MPIKFGRKMAWCSHCGRICNTSHDYPTNNTSCVECGKILFEGNITTKELTYMNRISHRHNKGRETIWCPHCAREGGTSHDHTTGIIHCVDCGKVLSEDKSTNNAKRGKDKRPKRAHTTKKPIPVKAAEDEYSKSDGHQWKSYDDEQESCSYDYNYNYNYDAGDESNDY